ncbi:putative undecaprenyl-phosphate N-acetylglucosaminyl 1-phosphate transferase [Paenibacillus sp. J31TS4]|uniref:MraY family glycosyltransferase n=1 Tax=Paenibacillus sp. J31TS4 TaxID=2807195 RepID=UPI001B0BC59C|nr:MraY family glycosyltransferase [Paenibacillus sp. J31TS4]GIP40969.1 putative undecaprenyl-phosphate N-acetylglucosaminyl 1-phosphate transferase [Paenibacillus sp. J31TS4]
MNWWLCVIGLVAACLLAVVLTPLVKKLAFWVGAVDIPNHRSVHSKPMARLGGLAIFLAFVGAYFIIAPATQDYDMHVALGMLLGGTIIVLVGALDDRFDLSPKVKLIGQIAAAAVVVSFGLKVDYLTLPFGDSIDLNNWVSIPITILWIVGVTNAINLIDGLDGLSAGVSGIATATILVLAIMMGNVTVILLSVVLLGSIIGFLFYNFHPAKIFMGDSGSLFLGFSLATLSVLGYKSATVVTFLVPIAILGVPLGDTFIAIVRRKLHRKPIFTADKGHLHHCLMSLGFSMKKTVLIIYGIATLFGICAVLLSQTSQWGTIVVTVIILLIMEVGAEAIGIISKSRKPVLQFIQRTIAMTRSRASK